MAIKIELDSQFSDSFTYLYPEKQYDSLPQKERCDSIA